MILLRGPQVVADRAAASDTVERATSGASDAIERATRGHL